MRRSIATARRAVLVSVLTVVVAIGPALPANATALSPFIDLQEAGLTAVQDGVGLKHLGSGTAALTVDVGGTVRFALLYWAGRDRPAPETGGVCDAPSEPYKDQQMVFDGTPLTGTIIGTECLPVTNKGPINNIGYFADVTSLVSAAGVGSHTFSLADGNLASNLWALNGATLFVGYTDASDPTVYRLLVQDALDFARASSTNGAEAQTTSPVTFNHGTAPSIRQAELYVSVGNTQSRRGDNITISTNPTLSNTLDRDDGAAWDADVVPISIPGDTGSTTVQVNSGPGAPEALLWEMVALRVPQPT